MMSVIVRELAERDLEEAFDWYEGQRAGLGAQFTAAIDRHLSRISSSPEVCQAVLGEVRRAVVRRFPYCIYYRIANGSIEVLAVLHGRRDSSVWQERIR